MPSKEYLVIETNPVNNQQEYYWGQQQCVQVGPLKTKEDGLTDDREGKLEILLSCYETLYASKQMEEGNRMDILDKVVTPTLTGDHPLFLDSDITCEEIQVALKELKQNTAPGPDGFTTEFFEV